MTTLAALLQQQPAALWLAAGALLLAAGVAAGSRALVRAAAAGPLAAGVAAVAPRAIPAEAAAFAVAALALAGWSLRRSLARGHAALAAPPPTAEGGAGDTALLGRTARVRSGFVDGRGEVLVGDAVHPARLAEDAPHPPAGALVRIVRVGEAALVVRPVPA